MSQRNVLDVWCHPGVKEYYDIFLIPHIKNLTLILMSLANQKQVKLKQYEAKID